MQHLYRPTRLPDFLQQQAEYLQDEMEALEGDWRLQVGGRRGGVQQPDLAPVCADCLHLVRCCDCVCALLLLRLARAPKPPLAGMICMSAWCAW
jgi:hypothetical protein